MQFSRKSIAIIALVIILVASNVAFAVLYMTKNLNITGGVSVVGSIELYEDRISSDAGMAAIHIALGQDCNTEDLALRLWRQR